MCCVFIKNSAYVDDQLEVFPAHGRARGREGGKGRGGEGGRGRGSMT